MQIKVPTGYYLITHQFDSLIEKFMFFNTACHAKLDEW